MAGWLAGCDDGPNIIVRVRLIINRDLGTERNRSIREPSECAVRETERPKERDREESVGRSRRRRIVYLGAFQIHGELLHLLNFIHYMVTIFFLKMMVSSSKALRGDFKTIVMRTKQEKCN